MLVCFYLLISLHLHITEVTVKARVPENARKIPGCTLDVDTGVKPVTAHTGGSVLLSCSCKDLQSKPKTVTWDKYTNDQWEVISPEMKKYKNRVEFFNDRSPGNLSLLISHLTEEDDGDYGCHIKGGEVRFFRLTVKGCSVNRKTETVTGSVGQSVLLPCFCSELQAKPRTLTWIFIIGPNQMQIFPTVQRNHLTDRVQVFNDLAPGNLSLLISHLSLQDGGWYRCHINNRDYRDIQLKVEAQTPLTTTPKITKTVSEADPTNKTTNLGANEETSGNEIIIIISSSIAGVLLLLLILGALVHWKYRGRRRGQNELGDGQTGQRTQQKKQDFSKPLNLTVTSETTEAVHKQNDSDVLYASINPQTKRNQAEEADDVTYSTMVHSNTSNTVRAAHTPVMSGDTAVYASIKNN